MAVLSWTRNPVPKACEPTNLEGPFIHCVKIWLIHVDTKPNPGMHLCDIATELHYTIASAPEILNKAWQP